MAFRGRHFAGPLLLTGAVRIKGGQRFDPNRDSHGAVLQATDSGRWSARAVRIRRNARKAGFSCSAALGLLEFPGGGRLGSFAGR